LFKGKELHLPGEIPLLTNEGTAAVQGMKYLNYHRMHSIPSEIGTITLTTI